jgi:hypothetical protein
MCELLTKILEKKEAWALIGVIVGAFVSVFIKWVGNILHRRRVKKALRNELERNLYTIIFKKDIIRQIIENLQIKKILSGNSVHSAKSVYIKYISLFSVYLKPIEMDNLHIIYEHLRHHDKFMDEFESRIKNDIESNRISDPWLKYEKDFKDINETYDLVQSLIKDYLENKPKDIYAELKAKIK